MISLKVSRFPQARPSPRIDLKNTSSYIVSVWFFLIFISLSLWAGSCSKPVYLPPKVVDPENLDRAALEEELIKNPPRTTYSIDEFVPFPEYGLPEEGDLTPYGNTLTQPWTKTLTLYRLGNGIEALESLDAAEKLASSVGIKWELAILRLKILIMMGRSADALDQVEQSGQLEKEFLGVNRIALSFEASIHFHLGNFSRARQTVALYLQSLGKWQFPASFERPPSNKAALQAVTWAKLRSMTIFAVSLAYEGRIEDSLPWMLETEQGFRRLHQFANHPFYSLFAKIPSDSIYGRAMNQAFLGAARLELNESPKLVRQTFLNALNGFEILGYKHGELYVAALKARALTRAGRIREANEAAEEALRKAQEMDAPEFIWRIAALRGEILARNGQMNEAEDSYRAAQTALDQVSGSLSSDKARTRFGVDKSSIDHFLIDLDWTRRDAEQLFEDLERGRARAFVDLMASRVFDAAKKIPEVNQLQKLEREIVETRMKHSLGMENDGITSGTKPLLEQRQQLLNILRQNYPDWATIFSIDVVPLSKIQKRLKKGERLIYVLPGKPEKPIRLFIIESENTDFHELGVSEKEVKEALGAFTESLGLPGEEVDAVEELLGLMQSEVWSPSKILYVVSSGAMHFMPWGLLEHDVPVVVLPTGGWLLRRPPSMTSGGKVVVVGNPEFGGKMNPLPGAEAEAKELALLFKTEALVGEKATLPELQERIGSGTQVMHLATHGIYNNLDPMRSAFYLTAKGTAQPVTAADLLADPLPARMVILSACETGMGKTVAGEDLLGLTRSFYLGGTVSVLSSLWPVEDAGTRQFMRIFHEEAIESGSLVSAWISARNALRDSDASPSVYGAFVLGGAATLH